MKIDEVVFAQLKRSVGFLTDEQIRELRGMLFDEETMRIRKNLGSYPVPSEDEKNCSNKINAIRSYYKRTGLGLMVSKVVLETYRND